MADWEEEIKKYLEREIDKYEKPCFDSSVFIAKLNSEIIKRIKREEVFDWIWEKAKRKEFEVIISPITLAEVHKIKRRTNGSPKTPKTGSIEVFHELIEEDFVIPNEVSRKTGLKAGEICRELKVSPNDGLILACALEAKCDVVLAWDVPLVGKEYEGIRIEEPFIYTRNLYNKTIEIATIEEQEEYDKELEKERNRTAKTSKSDIRGGDGKFIKDSATNGKDRTSEKQIPPPETGRKPQPPKTN